MRASAASPTTIALVPGGPFGNLWACATPRGVRSLALPGDEATPAAWRASGALPGGSAHLDRLAAQLERYWAGRLRVFELDIDLPPMAAFTGRVLAACRRIAWGDTLSYGRLAVLAGSPGAARAVGQAMGRNPLPIVIPCHRVLAAQGIGGYGGMRDALAIKRTLLAHEGVRVEGGESGSPGVRKSSR